MKERPIPYSAPMVRARRAGLKTMTRRAVKGNPHCVKWRTIVINGYGGWCDEHGRPTPCPYGAPGDRLWVREAWRTLSEYDHLPPRDVPQSAPIWYEADGLAPAGFGRYRHARFMCRRMSRGLDEVVDIRVERLQDISEEDAIAEGINCYPFRPDDGFPICSGYTHEKEDGKCLLHPSATKAFSALWESINGPDSWDANPWVWVIEFKQVSA